jgi:predicted ATPase/DNA-binding CsgD family transcriptional regulator
MTQKDTAIRTKPQELLEQLSFRELEVLRYIAKGSSDREIAQALFLSLNTIKWHNRQIYGKLGVPNRRQASLLASKAGILQTQAVPIQALEPISRHNLPAQVTSFIGREKEIAEVTTLLASVRLLTVTGPGGVGKTRLSLHTAISILDAGIFSDGIYFVDLASLADPGLVAIEIANVLGLPETAENSAQILKQFLHDKQILLIMDNFEHVLKAAPMLSELLKECPSIKIMATSRESLQLSGEQVYALAPLDKGFAITLFNQRAQAVKHDIELDQTNLDTIEKIIKRLDGLPLAIELAAARVVLLTPQVLYAQLENRLDTLTGNMRDATERQQTLRATLDWSYQLLDAHEKKLFNRLGVFYGGASLAAVEEVCGAGLSLDLFTGLESLLNKSMLNQEADWEGSPRFILLETMREYALEQLDNNGEIEAVRSAHTSFFLSFAENIVQKEQSSPATLTKSNSHLEQEIENLSVAFSTSFDGDASHGLRIFIALERFWYTRHPMVGKRWLIPALENAHHVSPEIRAKTLITAAVIAETSGDWVKGGEYEKEAVALFREMDNEIDLAKALSKFGLTNVQLRNYGLGEELLREALTIFTNFEIHQEAAFALNSLGEIRRIQGNFKEARALYEDSLEERLKVTEASSGIFFNLGACAYFLGDNQEAGELFIKSIEAGKSLGDVGNTGLSIIGLAGVLSSEGDAELGAQLIAAGVVNRESTGHIIEPTDMPVYDRSIADTRAHLDEVAFDAAWKVGRTMTLEEATELAFNTGQDNQRKTKKGKPAHYK